jgi:hypothetical protein
MLAVLAAGRRMVVYRTRGSSLGAARLRLLRALPTCAVSVSRFPAPDAPAAAKAVVGVALLAGPCCGCAAGLAGWLLLHAGLLCLLSLSLLSSYSRGPYRPISSVRHEEFYHQADAPGRHWLLLPYQSYVEYCMRRSS